MGALAVYLPIAAWSEEGPLVDDSPQIEGESTHEQESIYIEGNALAEEQRKTWVDSGHDYVADQAQALVQWMDDFYGTELADSENAHSRVRLRLETRYDEVDDFEFKVKVRAKVQLPKMSKRAALILEGDDGDEYTAPGVPDDDDTNIGLQFNLMDSDEKRLRFDVIGTVNSSLDLRTGVRMRYNGSFTEGFSTRWVQDVAYQTGDRGAFTKTNLDFFQHVDDNNQIAFINRLEYGEDTYGVEWNSSLQWRKRLDNEEALSYFIGMDGVTDPLNIVENYGLGLSYRRNIYRDFISVDVEPSHWWRELAGWEERRSVWAVMVRLEIRFEKLNKKARDNAR
jgi:hypothetical protein